MKRALITGITGQDGSHLAELLLNKNYKVHGVIRRASSGGGRLGDRQEALAEARRSVDITHEPGQGRSDPSEH